MNPFFKNTLLKVYTLTPAAAAGLYGEPVEQYTPAGNLFVDFQNENNNELRKMYGVERQNLYKIYFDLNEDIKDTDILEDPDGTKYEIIGQIQKYKQFHKYQKAHIIKLRTKPRGAFD